jgi:hypothetical protein
MKKLKYQLVRIAITASGIEVPVEFNTEKGYAMVTGVTTNSSDRNAYLGCYFNRFEINNREIFPEGYEVKMITTGIDVPADDRFYSKIMEPADGTKVSIKYKDGGNANAYPYTATIYLRLENAN